MTDWTQKFDRVFIHEASRDSSLAQKMLAAFPASHIEWVLERPFPESKGELSASEFDRSKRHLFLTPFQGQYFKRCPGSQPGLLCCNYFVLNWGTQCDMNCSYCYLQSFINSPVTTLYTNLDKAFSELRDMYTHLGHQKVRIGTGETVDSLSLDPLTGHAAELMNLFREFPNWTVEFKTKSAHVEQFLSQPHAGNAIISWSVNPQPVIEAEEHLTASLLSRLEAAQKCRQKGFQVALHLDPVIWHPEWQKNYDTLVDEICARFAPKDVSFLSIGALRFQPEQRHLMRERFGLSSLVTRAEMFQSRDGKLRYPLRLRNEMFGRIRSQFLTNSSEWRIFLCMETPESWTAGSPFQKDDLQNLFDPKVTKAVERWQTSERQ